MKYVHGSHGPRNFCTPPRRDAFTLVELLVVVGIIAVLIGILMPSLSAARRSSQITKCLAVQRQIGIAAQLNMQAHRGYYPVAGRFAAATYADPETLLDANRLKYTYVYVTDIDGAPWARTSVVPWHAALAVYMGKPQAVLGSNNVDFLEDQIGIRDYLKYFLCPAHTGHSIDAEPGVIYETGTIYWTIRQSYVLNEAVFGVDDYRGRLRGQASKISNPAQILMLMDGRAAPAHGGVQQWFTIINTLKPGKTHPNGRKVANFPLSEGLDPTFDPPIVSAKGNFDKNRHKGRINILFMDGHAETRRVEPGDLNNVLLLPRGK